MTARRRLFLRPLESRLAPATLSGLVFGDYDGNGVKAANERPEANVAVRLDLGGDGTFDATANTAADGSYSFTAVPDGMHKVAVTVPTGFTASSTATIAVGVAGGADIGKLNFALMPAGTINGVAFRDDNFNGSRDTGETALANAVINIDYFGDGSTDATATSDSSGAFAFTGVPAGTHTDTATLAGSTLTNPSSAGVTIAVGGTATLTPGFVPSAVVSGFVFVDQNANGKFDSGEKLAVGSQVALDLDNDGTNDVVTTTDSNGQFHFTGVTNGTHAVVIPTLPATPTRRTATVTGGADVTGLAFGLTPSGKLTGTVFADLNGNGLKETGEAGLSGVAVALDFFANGTTDETVTTGSDGSYTFSDIPDGSHTLTVSRTGYSKTTDNPIPIIYTNGLRNPGPVPDVVFVPPEQRIPGNNYTATVPDPTVFGLAPSAVVSGFVFGDTNNNGTPDAGEKEVANAVVTLDVNGDGTVDQTSTTNATGRYFFAAVPNGLHFINVTAPAGFAAATTPTKTTVAAGADNKNIGIALRPFGSVAGVVFADTNGNGVRDSGEAALSGANVALQRTGFSDRAAVTDANGVYTFSDVADASYRVTVLPPSGFIVGPKTQAVQSAVIGSGRGVSGVSFGLATVTSPAVVGVVFYDSNGNGVRDANEPLATGVSANLVYDPSVGTVPATAFPGTTGADGVFRINPSVSAKYLLGVAPPTGFVATTAQNQSVTFAGTDVGGFALGIRPSATSPSTTTQLLTGTIFRDENGNGIQDAADGVGSGAIVTVTPVGGVPLVTTTNSSGQYSFAGLPDGTDTLTVSALTKTNTSSITIGGSATVTKTVGIVPPRSLAVTLFLDTNGNGLQDSGELAAPGVGLSLDLNGDGTVDSTLTTDSTGTATFTAIPDGNHLLGLSLTGAVLTGGAVPFNVANGVATPQAVTIGYRFPATKVIAVGSDSSTLNSVVLLDSSGRQVSAFAPFGTPAGARVATGDVNGDGTEDYAVGSGGTTGPTFAAVPSAVRVLDGKTGAELFTILPFGSNFFGGVFVALGDVNNDGRADLIITPDVSGGPRVRIFNGSGFVQIADFFGIDDANFRGGARAAVGDVNGDGRSDLIVAAGTGGGPRVAIFDGSKLATTGGPKLVGDFFAFDESLRNGTFLAIGDVNGDGFADIVCGAGPGGGPRVTTYSGKAIVSGAFTKLTDFFAGGQIGDRSGVKVAIADVDSDGKADIVTGYRTVTLRQARVATYLSTAATANGTPASAFDVEPFAGYIGGIYVG